MHGSVKPSQQTPPGNRGCLLLSAGPVTNPTDVSAATAAKRAPGRATLPENTSKHRCVQGHRGEFLPKGAQIPPWRSGWTRRKAADRRKTSGIKPTPVSDSEEQAAPGRDRARRSGETRGRVADAGSQRRGSRTAAPPILAPPHLPAPPPGRSTPGAGPTREPMDPAPPPDVGAPPPHRCTLGLVVLKRVNTRAWSHGDYSSQHAERGPRPSARRRRAPGAKPGSPSASGARGREGARFADPGPGLTL